MTQHLTLAKFSPLPDIGYPIIEFEWLGVTRATELLEGELEIAIKLNQAMREDDEGNIVPSPGNYNVVGFRTVEACGKWEAVSGAIGFLSHNPTLLNMQDVIARVGR